MRRTKEQALETREGILDAAERVFFERGVSRTTLEQVACAAGVTRGAVYWHFRNKSDLFLALVARTRTPMEAAVHRIAHTAGTLADLERLCLTSLLELHRDEQQRRVYATLLLKCEYTEEMVTLIERERAAKDELTDSLTRFFARLQRAAHVSAAHEPRTLALAVYAYMLGLFTDYLRAPERYRMPEDAQKLVRQFFAPLDPGPAE